MRNLILAIAMAATAAPVMVAQPAAAQGREHWREEKREAHQAKREWKEERREAREARRDWREGRRYDWNRPDPRYGNRYDASAYYRDGRYYKERRLSRNDRVYRGNDGRYYCRREDGTTGLIIGALAGGLLGNTIANGKSTTLATLLGAGGGALIGRSIDRGDARCR